MIDSKIISLLNGTLSSIRIAADEKADGRLLFPYTRKL